MYAVICVLGIPVATIMGFPWPSVVGPVFCCLGVFVLLVQRWRYEGRLDVCGRNGPGDEGKGRGENAEEEGGVQGGEVGRG